MVRSDLGNLLISGYQVRVAEEEVPKLEDDVLDSLAQEARLSSSPEVEIGVYTGRGEGGSEVGKPHFDVRVAVEVLGLGETLELDNLRVE